MRPPFLSRRPATDQHTLAAEPKPLPSCRTVTVARVSEARTSVNAVAGSIAAFREHHGQSRQYSGLNRQQAPHRLEAEITEPGQFVPASVVGMAPDDPRRGQTGRRGGQRIIYARHPTIDRRAASSPRPPTRATPRPPRAAPPPGAAVRAHPSPRGRFPESARRRRSIRGPPASPTNRHARVPA